MFRKLCLTAAAAAAMIASGAADAAKVKSISLDLTSGSKPTHSSSGGLIAVAMKSFAVAKTTNYSCAVKMPVPGPMKLHLWKADKFDCASRLIELASDNLSPVPPSQAPQPENPTETNPEVPFKLEGQLTYVDANAPQCRRTLKALFTILSSEPGPADYRLDCEDGPYLSGTLDASPNAEGYLAVGLRNITIAKQRILRCKLIVKRGQTYRELAFERTKAECSSGIAPPRHQQLRRVHQVPKRTKPVRIRPHRPKPQRVIVTKKPKCTSQWRSTCTRKPVRSCKNVATRHCKTTPKVTCTSRPKRTCQRVPKRKCQTVRGRQVCNTTWSQTCRVTTQRNCKRTLRRTCGSKVVQKCRTSWKQACKRTKQVICKRR